MRTQAFVDNHLNLAPGHSRGGRSIFSKMESAKDILKEVNDLNLADCLLDLSFEKGCKRGTRAIPQNQKILSAIQTTKPFVSSMDHRRHDAINMERVRMLSSYRGPESARYMPQRSSSPSSSMQGTFPRLKMNGTYAGPSRASSSMLSTR